MNAKRISQGIKLISIFLLFFLLVTLEAAPLKIKVTIDNAGIKARSEIGGKDLIKVPLGTILEAEKKGEWYRVSWEGVTGFIHELMVEEVSEAEISGSEVGGPRGGKSQAELVAEIEIKIDESRKLIRQEKDIDIAINNLRPLIAKAIGISDQKRQKELTTQIFLWSGLAYCAKGDDLSALREFRNMFEIDQVYAKEVTRNILDPKVMALIQQGENEFLGLITEYSLDITTEPKEAMIKINGKEIGLSPEIVKTQTPKVTIEIEKAGYKPIKEETFISQSPLKKEYILEKVGVDVEVKSVPTGARVYLDGADAGKVTDCTLPVVPLGLHKIMVVKENYGQWEEEVDVQAGKGPLSVEAVLIANKYQFIYKWGDPDKLFFKLPLGITVDRENSIYIVDSGASKIKKFSAEGKFQERWGTGGIEFRRLKTPAGVAVDSQGFIYVTDSKAHCVAKFDKNGKFIAKWGAFGVGKLNLNIPVGIAIDGNNDIYVADSANSRIVKYSVNGVFKKMWGSQGTATGSFIFPVAIAISPKNEIFVLDRNRIQKFTSEGEFISSWGKPGTGDGEFSRANGIFVDQLNCIYIADSGNNRIQKLDQNGTFITKWGTSGTAAGQMIFPTGVAVDSRGYVYVIEKDNNRLQLFGVVPSSGS